MRRLLFVLVVALVVVAASFDAFAANCVTKPATCGARLTGSLEDSGCKFYQTETVYASHSIELAAGTVLEARASSGAFVPELRLTFGRENIRVLDAPGGVATLTFQVPYDGVYRIAVSAKEGNAGQYFLDLSCTQKCLPPVLRRGVMPYEVSYEARVQLSAPVYGTDLRYRWYDVAAPGITISEEASFLSPPITGPVKYGVTVRNDCGTISGEIASISVRACAVPQIVREPADLTVRAGERALFTVVASGAPPFRYDWYEGESGDTSHPVTEGATSSALEVTGPRRNGSYWVRVTNGCGALDSRTATLTVEPRRRATRH